MKAVILAGGRGTRLAPYTTVLPKPLVPVGEMPILEIVVRQLIHSGFDEIIITLGYLGEIIRAFFAAHPELSKKARFTFIQEDKPTGTAGSLRLIPDLNDVFLVMNGDILTSLDYRALMDFHIKKGTMLTVATHQKTVKIDLGVLDVDEISQTITNYIEKPKYTYSVSMGIYVYDPRTLAFIPEHTYYDFPELAMDLINKGKIINAYMNDALWLDIGRYEDCEHAQKALEENRLAFIPSST